MGELAVIFGFIILISIIAFGWGGAIHKRDLDFKQRKLELEASKSSGIGPEAARKIEMLEQRVRVLERLATDRGQDLALQIENLRNSAQPEIAPDYPASREETRA
ncbi:hypothetical protein [Allopontixanthobacter sediminis]|uniref:Phage shock protein B n=1 Tax=Allopontixanthobacter sediminis TaxID=1689985 RepID=A0A845ATZ0_9SPHN|nr:hypothetical protein [Allopontixanthobacter sediminis]MXP43023.1 hypothetical protein [Allopontixanthobacter sediminis]